MEREEAERLVARYGPSVYRLAYARTGSKEDAEDVSRRPFSVWCAPPRSFGMRRRQGVAAQGATHCCRRRISDALAETGSSAGGGPGRVIRTAEGARQQCAGGGAVPAGEIPPPGPFILL